jgi:hypothetical protein
MIDDVREVLESITTESHAVRFIDGMMRLAHGPALMLDVFCDAPAEVRWWGVFYRDWC